MKFITTLILLISSTLLFSQEESGFGKPIGSVIETESGILHVNRDFVFREDDGKTRNQIQEIVGTGALHISSKADGISFTEYNDSEGVFNIPDSVRFLWSTLYCQECIIYLEEYDYDWEASDLKSNFLVASTGTLSCFKVKSDTIQGVAFVVTDWNAPDVAVRKAWEVKESYGQSYSITGYLVEEPVFNVDTYENFTQLVFRHPEEIHLFIPKPNVPDYKR